MDIFAPNSNNAICISFPENYLLLKKRALIFKVNYLYFVSTFKLQFKNQCAEFDLVDIYLGFFFKLKTRETDKDQRRANDLWVPAGLQRSHPRRGY